MLACLQGVSDHKPPWLFLLLDGPLSESPVIRKCLLQDFKTTSRQMLQGSMEVLGSTRQALAAAAVVEKPNEWRPKAGQHRKRFEDRLCFSSVLIASTALPTHRKHVRARVSSSSSTTSSSPRKRGDHAAPDRRS